MTYLTKFWHFAVWTGTWVSG